MCTFLSTIFFLVINSLCLFACWNMISFCLLFLFDNNHHHTKKCNNNNNVNRSKKAITENDFQAFYLFHVKKWSGMSSFHFCCVVSLGASFFIWQNLYYHFAKKKITAFTKLPLPTYLLYLPFDKPYYHAIVHTFALWKWLFCQHSCKKMLVLFHFEKSHPIFTYPRILGVSWSSSVAADLTQLKKL